MSRTLFTTDRLLIRTMTLDDLNPLAAIFADPEVMRYMGRGNTATRSQTREMIVRRGVRGRDNDKNVWAMVRVDTGRLVGTCGILDTDLNGQHEVEIGYQLARHAWHHGYATEAAKALLVYGFETLGLPRLIAMTHPDNTRSQQVIKRAGMQFERQIMLPKGPRRIYAKYNKEA